MDVQKAVTALLLGAVPGVVHRRCSAGCRWPGPGPGAPPTGRGETSKAGSRHGRHYRRAQKQRFDPGRLVCEGQVCMDAKQAAVESG